jgi:hypothetical protein
MSEQIERDTVKDSWEELKIILESVELDMVKNINGNKSAGVRARKGLRLLKKKAADVIRASVNADKE